MAMYINILRTLWLKHVTCLTPIPYESTKVPLWSNKKSKHWAHWASNIEMLKRLFQNAGTLRAKNQARHRTSCPTIDIYIYYVYIYIYRHVQNNRQQKKHIIYIYNRCTNPEGTPRKVPQTSINWAECSSNLHSSLKNRSLDSHSPMSTRVPVLQSLSLAHQGASTLCRLRYALACELSTPCRYKTPGAWRHVASTFCRFFHVLPTR